MAAAMLDDFVYLWERQLSDDDPRVGSARDNSTSTKVTGVTTGANSASFSTLFMTFVPVLIYAAVCAIIFVTLRRRYPRVYHPRTFLSSLEPQDRLKALPTGWFDWFMPFWRAPDIDVLNHSSLDGFLFLRFLKVLLTICCFGVCLTWPILLPLHRYGGGGNKQLDMLTFGNIAHVDWMYVHAFLAWIFFGFVLYMVTRECIFFINIRQAYLLSPYYADRLSSRTVLFTCVPYQILDERKLRRIFGDAVKNVWVPRDTGELDELVKEREQTANRLEKAEIELLKKANAAYQKTLENGQPEGKSITITDSASYRESKATKNVGYSVQAESVGSQSPTSPPGDCSPTTSLPAINRDIHGAPVPDVNGSVAAQWIAAEERPAHRPIANYGRRVDTIKWTRGRLKELGSQISKLKRDYKKGKASPLPAAFIEFHTQVDAQAAYQTLAHHRANHMRPEIVGVRPQEIVWGSLYFPWWQRIIRRFLTQGFVALMVIFWSFPAALVGIISNVENLSTEVFFLHWIDDLPSVVLGLVSGLLPAVALSLLMSLVPGIMRMCARQAGVPTESRIELFVQNAYFVFQIVQVFLITTLTSAASAALAQILEDPLSARTLLSQNLPKASNFYISYFILQGLAMSSTRLVHLGSLWRYQLMLNSSSSPRSISAKYHRLRKMHWGSIYPVFTNMGVVALSYSMIAPIVLGVAVVGFSVIYVTYRYNLLYVYGSQLDTRGLCYPRALTQLLTGIYLAEICLVGLFALKGAYGPTVMTLGLIIFSALVTFSLNDALGPLMYNLPRTLAAEEALRQAGNWNEDAVNLTDAKDDQEPELDVERAAAASAGYDSDFDPGEQDQVSHGVQGSRSGIPDHGIEGADAAFNLTTTTVRAHIRKKMADSAFPKLVEKIDFWSYWITPDPATKVNPFITLLVKWLHPEVFADYHVLRELQPPEIREHIVTYGEGLVRDAYAPPSVRTKSPRIWIPADKLRVSKQEVMHTGRVCEISELGAWMDEKGRVTVDLECETGRWVERGIERIKF